MTGASPCHTDNEPQRPRVERQSLPCLPQSFRQTCCRHPCRPPRRFRHPTSTLLHLSLYQWAGSHRNHPQHPTPLRDDSPGVQLAENAEEEITNIAIFCKLEICLHFPSFFFDCPPILGMGEQWENDGRVIRDLPKDHRTYVKG